LIIFQDEDAEEIPRKLSYDGVHPTKKGYRSMEECYKR
jgi:lysophospholipase L1-like esterase